MIMLDSLVYITAGVIIVALSLVALRYVRPWLFLCLDCASYLNNKAQFYADYKQFTKNPQTKVIIDLLRRLPVLYEDRQQLYKANKELVYKYCVRYILGIVALSGLAILIILAFPALSWLEIIDIHIWYTIIPSLVLMGTIIIQQSRLQRDNQFYSSMMMELAFKKIDKKVVLGGSA